LKGNAFFRHAINTTKITKLVNGESKIIKSSTVAIDDLRRSRFKPTIQGVLDMCNIFHSISKSLRALIGDREQI
jgi:hypothetical protein